MELRAGMGVIEFECSQGVCEYAQENFEGIECINRICFGNVGRRRSRKGKAQSGIYIYLYILFLLSV